MEQQYNVGDQVLLEKSRLAPKLDPPRKGPYTVTHVGTNGTVKIQRGAVVETVNMRRVTPYLPRDN